MSETTKSGQEIVTDFFKSIKTRTDIDDSVKSVLTDLHESNKFTNTNIANALLKKREEALNDNNN